MSFPHEVNLINGVKRDSQIMEPFAITAGFGYGCDFCFDNSLDQRSGKK